MIISKLLGELVSGVIRNLMKVFKWKLYLYVPISKIKVSCVEFWKSYLLWPLISAAKVFVLPSSSPEILVKSPSLVSSIVKVVWVEAVVKSTVSVEPAIPIKIHHFVPVVLPPLLLPLLSLFLHNLIKRHVNHCIVFFHKFGRKLDFLFKFKL